MLHAVSGVAVELKRPWLIAVGLKGFRVYGLRLKGFRVSGLLFRVVGYKGWFVAFGFLWIYGRTVDSASG